MMKCKIISISHKPSDWEKQALQFYSKQLPNYLQISYVEVKPFSSKSMDVISTLEAEGLEILKHVDQDAHVILWDRQGQRRRRKGPQQGREEPAAQKLSRTFLSREQLRRTLEAEEMPGELKASLGRL